MTVSAVEPLTDIHPRVSINSASSYLQPLSADLELWRSIGIDHVGLVLPKLAEMGIDVAKQEILQAGLKVSTLFGPVMRPLDADPATRVEDSRIAVEAIELAAEIGAQSVYLLSGAAPTLGWDEAAVRFAEVVAPAVARGAELGVPLLLEPTNPLRVDLSFVFWQRDALDLARQSGTRVLVDLQSSWCERGLADLVRDNLDLIGLVQVSDYVIGTAEAGNRVVPGDGDIPLERILGAILEAGYEGAFDLEVFGPKVEAEGYASSARRSVEATSELLRRLGA